MSQEPLTSWSMREDKVDDSSLPHAADGLDARDLAGQLFVHGVLIAAHPRRTVFNDDAVASIMAAVAAPPRRKNRHGWVHVAAAALLLCAFAWPFLFVENLPEARASVLRGAQLLGEDVDRRFAVEAIAVSEHGVGQNHQQFQLTARPGKRFLVEGSLELGPIRFAAMRFGCDGRQVWFHSFGEQGSFGEKGSLGEKGDLPEVRRAGPLDEAPSLLRGIGNVLDLGLLDVHSFVRELSDQFELETKARVTDSGGQRLLHVVAKGGPVRTGFRLHQADLWCCERTGCIVRLEVRADDGFGRVQQLNFVDQGPMPVDASIYERPW